jgi:hypoxanthine phosphoribosyltransferase
MATNPTHAWKDALRTLIPRERIAVRVEELGRQIAQDYAGQTLVLLTVLKGSSIFSADLARAIDAPVRLEFLGVRSYGDSSSSSGAVQITQDVTSPLEGQHVLVVEDIVDTGLTSSFLLETLASRRPASVKLCALLHKPARSVKAVPIDYLGFTIEDVFVVGYGLDFAQEFRNLPDLAVYEGSVSER